MTTPGSRARVVLLGGVLMLVVSLPLNHARAADGETARSYNAKATAAFALSRYAEAAEFYEKAFELKQDPALLYNAAQAHRLAGNKERALSLYQNYLRIYGNGADRAKAQAHVQELKAAIERDSNARERTAAAPETAAAGGAGSAVAAAEPVAPVVPLDSAARAASPPPAIAPAPSSSSGTAVTALGAPAAQEEAAAPPGKSSPWLWVAVGGGVVAAAAVILLLTLGGSKDPSPSFGKTDGN